ncbi:MAG: hypothetical protein IKK26_05370 [Clostridia bacterium]|nr:hypothetical protein [Clostridia bacterium]
MTISEVSEILSFPEEHIRLYIKQDLIPGIKRNAKEPDVSEKELTYIKRVIILRRLRWRFIDIANYMHGKDALYKTAESIAYLMEKDYEHKIRPDFYIFTKQIADEKNPQLDTDRYWELINTSEELKNNIVEPELNLRSFIMTDHPNGYIQKDPNSMSIKNTVILLSIVFLIAGIITFIEHRTIFSVLNSYCEAATVLCAVMLFKTLVFFMRRILGARICHGFVAVIVIVLSLVVSVASVIPLIILSNKF